MKILCVLSRYAYGKPERGENYDYVHFLPAFERMGHEVDFFDSGDRSLFNDFADLNRALLERVAGFRPDVIFCVLMHYEVWFETLDLIRANSPALVVNWGTDDSWKFWQASRFFAGHVDLHVTTDRMAAEAAAPRGLDNVLLSQWAASGAALAEPCPSQACRHDVSFVGSMYGLDSSTTHMRTKELLEFMQLANEKKKLVTDFSHGMQKKLALAAAVIHGPKVLFLDEPFEGVDAVASGMLKSMLTGMINRGATIFLTTHVLEIVERLCSHVAIISQGKLVANGSIEALRAGVASSLPGTEAEQRLTLEEIFLAIVGADGQQESTQELSWLT